MGSDAQGLQLASRLRRSAARRVGGGGQQERERERVLERELERAIGRAVRRYEGTLARRGRPDLPGSLILRVIVPPATLDYAPPRGLVQSVLHRAVVGALRERFDMQAAVMIDGPWETRRLAVGAPVEVSLVEDVAMGPPDLPHRCWVGFELTCFDAGGNPTDVERQPAKVEGRTRWWIGTGAIDDLRLPPEVVPGLGESRFLAVLERDRIFLSDRVAASAVGWRAFLDGEPIAGSAHWWRPGAKLELRRLASTVADVRAALRITTFDVRPVRAFDAAAREEQRPATAAGPIPPRPGTGRPYAQDFVSRHYDPTLDGE